MDYQEITVTEDITITRLYTIHYFEYLNNFRFPGESHDFWELVYVDKGEVIVTAGSNELTLKKGELWFHPPGEFHSIAADGKTAPNLVVVSFDCRDRELFRLKDTLLHLDESERSLLAAIIIEARKLFDCRLDDPYMKHMPLKQPQPFGAGQLIRTYLTELLIRLIRQVSQPIVLEASLLSEAPLPEALSDNDRQVFGRIVRYLEQHINEKVTLTQISRDNLTGASGLQRIFRRAAGMSVIAYFEQMKISAARQMIREGSLNFTEIADALGYSSVHYFSRHFKKLTNMTPSEYLSSIKAIADDRE